MTTAGLDEDKRGGHARPFRLALGLERIGLVPLRYPAIVAVIALLFSAFAAFGIGRIQIDDSLSQLFRSETPEFRQYEEVTRRFPSSEFDVLLVVEGKMLLERGPLGQMRDLVTDLQLIDGTRGIISLFSARSAPEAGRLPGPLFPEELPEGEEYKALVDRVMSNDIIKGKLLSPDGHLALVVLPLEPSVAESSKLGETVKEIRETVATDLAGTGLKTTLSGVPVMQLEIRRAVERDRIFYNAIGFFAGCLIAILFFRRASFMIVAAGPPLIAILFALGTLGWLDFRLNIFLNVMTPLIMVISFSDSMQLTFAARDRLIAGEDKLTAFRNAVLVVGPACVLTHATAGLSFVALLFSSSDLIRTFGEAGLISTVIALVAVLMLAPLFGLLLVRREAAFAANIKGADTAVDGLRAFCRWIAVHMVGRPGLYSLGALVLVAALGAVYASLETRYRLADLVPDKEQSLAASGRLDLKLTGSNPVDVLVQFPPGTPLYRPDTLEVIGAVHTAVEEEKAIGNVWSVETLRRWLLEKAGKSDMVTLRQYVGVLPVHLVRRFIAPAQDAVIITGRVPDIDSSGLLPVIDRLDKRLDAVRAQYPDYKISVTGLSAIAARNSASMIGRLNQGLTIEIVFVAAFIGLAFRSGVVALAALLPGIFPVLASGDLLWVMGKGLQFASVVALIVSFGLGLSAMIHFLNRLRLEERPGEDAGPGIERATVLVGPAVILTSIVLACGLAVTVLSNLPSLRLFGWLSAFAMIAALFADLVVLRPVLMFLRREAGRLGRRS